MKRVRSPSPEGVLQTSYKRLYEVKQEENAIIRELDRTKEEIDQLKKQLMDKEEKARDTYRTCFEKLDNLGQTFQEAAKPFSQAWHCQFMQAMRARLPREIRDMIYESLWPRSNDIHYSREAELVFQVAVFEGRIEHYMDPAYVGIETAYEVVAALYRVKTPEPLMAFSVEEMQSCLLEDVFKVGFKPAMVMRRFHLFIRINKYAHGKRGRKTVLIKTDGLKEGLNSLFEIPQKQGFDLRITVVQRNLYLSMFEEALQIIEPVFRGLQKEGMNVEVEHCYDSGQPDMIPSSVVRSVNHCFGLSRNERKQDAIDFFEKGFYIFQDGHKKYLKVDSNGDEDWEVPYYVHFMIFNHGVEYTMSDDDDNDSWEGDEDDEDERHELENPVLTNYNRSQRRLGTNSF